MRRLIAWWRARAPIPAPDPAHVAAQREALAHARAALRRSYAALDEELESRIVALMLALSMDPPPRRRRRRSRDATQKPPGHF